MASMVIKRSSMINSFTGGLKALASRAYASIAVGSDLVSAAPNVSLQKARSYDEGVASQFSTTPLDHIFKGKKVVIFGLPINRDGGSNILQVVAVGVLIIWEYSE